jgi:3-hydroxybutyryl-CoA dehydrogenase
MKPIRAVVAAPEGLWKEISETTGAEWIRVSSLEEMLKMPETEVFFYLHDDVCTLSPLHFPGTLFVNAVCLKQNEIPLTGNICRMNAWPGFIGRNVWEISGTVSEDHRKILSALDKDFVVTADEPGFVSARVLAMIINEAYFALEEKVSTKKEMDTALRLGTNYPMGPFEWAEKIGIKGVYELLEKLSGTDSRYMPAPMLKKESGEPS